MKTSEESFAASSCSVDGSCSTSQGRLTAGGGLGSPSISNLMCSIFLPLLVCLEMAGCSFLWVLRLYLIFWSFHSCSTLHRAAEAQPGGEHHLQYVQRKPISAHSHQPCIIFLPLVFPQSWRGEGGGRQEPSPHFQNAGVIPAIRLVRMWWEWESQSSVLTQRFVNESLWSQADFPVLFLDAVRITEGCRF